MNVFLARFFGNDLTEIEKSLQLLNPGPITSSIKCSSPYQHWRNPLVLTHVLTWLIFESLC